MTTLDEIAYRDACVHMCGKCQMGGYRRLCSLRDRHFIPLPAYSVIVPFLFSQIESHLLYNLLERQLHYQVKGNDEHRLARAQNALDCTALSDCTGSLYDLHVSLLTAF